MNDASEIRYESVVRERWRDRQSAATRPGVPIKQQRWIDAGLVAFGVLLTAGAVAAVTVTTDENAALPTVTQGNSVTAIRGGDTPISAPAGGLVVPTVRQRLIFVLLPRLR